jgi:hypothetical protein
MTKTIDGLTYTIIDSETAKDERGGEWVAWDRAAMLSKIRWADREMAQAAKAGLEDENNAAVYTQALEIQAETEEDLRVLELLFG